MEKNQIIKKKNQFYTYSPWLSVEDGFLWDSIKILICCNLWDEYLILNIWLTKTDRHTHPFVLREGVNKKSRMSRSFSFILAFYFMTHYDYDFMATLPVRKNPHLEQDDLCRPWTGCCSHSRLNKHCLGWKCSHLCISSFLALLDTFFYRKV